MKKSVILILMLFALVSCGKKNQTPDSINDIPEIEDISDIENIPETTAGEISTTEISKSEIRETESTGTSGTTEKSASSETKKSKTETTTKSNSKTTATSAKSGNKSGNNEKISAENNSEPESVTPEPLEYLEYFPEDFAEINIDIIRPDGEPPAVISEYALELPDVGVEYSPCKSPKYHDRYKDKYSYRFTSYDSDGNSHFDEEKYSEICNSGYTGRYMDITFDGKYLYYIISFDDLCQYSTHCFKIMKYDVETAENEELYSYSGTDYYYNNLHIKSINDDLYIRYDKVSDDEESEHRSVAEIDRIKKGRLEKIFDDSTPRLFLELTDYNTDKLILSSYSSYFDENEEYHATGQLYEYNSGKLNEIYSADYDGSYLNTVFPPMRYRNEFLSVETDENDTINIYSDNFRLNTGLRNAKLTSATDKVISFVVQDSLSCFMYVYNFERMERYQLNIKSLADVYGVTPIGDNFILSNGGRTHVFLIPEIGATFLIKSFDESCSAHTDGRMVWIADSESDIIYTDVDGTMPANKPSMLYVVEPQ